MTSPTTTLQVFKCVMRLISDMQFRNVVLQLLAKLYSAQTNPDYMNICRCWIFLDDSAACANLIGKLIKNDELAMAYQVAFDLYDSATQQYLTNIKSSLASLKELLPFLPGLPATPPCSFEMIFTSLTTKSRNRMRKNTGLNTSVSDRTPSTAPHRPATHTAYCTDPTLLNVNT